MKGNETVTRNEQNQFVNTAIDVAFPFESDVNIFNLNNIFKSVSIFKYEIKLIKPH